MKKIDLHIHTVSTKSDKSFDFSMDALLKYIKDASLDAIAITNHNLFDADQFLKISKSISIPVFPGIEIDLEGGHLLLITSPEDYDDFIPKCCSIYNLKTSSVYITEPEFEQIFTNPEKYILIPHYDKSPKLDLNRVPNLKPYIKCGEVSSPRKFHSLKKKNDLVPLLFSDIRISNQENLHSDKQTYLDIEAVSFNSIKNALYDKSKVYLSENEGHSLFQVLENGLKISDGLTVLMGERSSGKTYTLNEIDKKYDNDAYIHQFELLAKDDEKDQKKFEEYLRHKGTSISEEFLAPFKEVVDDIQRIDLQSDELTIENYISALKKAANEAEDNDIFAKTKFFFETPFNLKSLSTLEEIISALDSLINNDEYKEIIEQYIPRENMLLLAISLCEKFIEENNCALRMKFINEIISSIKNELQTYSTNTSIPEVDFYTILMNQQKVLKFEDIVEKLKHYNIPIEQSNLYSFTIIATVSPFLNARDLRNELKTKAELSSSFIEYPNAYKYFCKLRKNENIESSEYYKCFVKIRYSVLNQYGGEASGGERSEFNLLEKLKDAASKEILLLDEPESSFDNLFLKNGVNNTLKELSTKMPVVVATHNNTIGASLQPDYLLYTKKEVLPDGEIKYHIYSGYPSEKFLTDLNGNKLIRRDILLDCFEAGEEAYLERRDVYEIPSY